MEQREGLMMMTDEDLREQRREQGSNGERIGSRVVERACRGGCVRVLGA